MPVIDPVKTHALFNPAGQAVVDLETSRRWSYCELHEAVDRLASWLVSRLGEASGERIATLSKNSAEMLILQLASARAGCIFVPLNWRLSAREITILAEDAEPTLMFLGQDMEAPVGSCEVLPIDDLLELGEHGDHPPSSARRSFDETSTLLYTSGTSGRPKGVMLSEKNIFWGCSNFLFGNNVSMDSVFLCDMPLFHTAGLLAATRVPILAGGCVLISRGFDAPVTLDRLMDDELGVTHYFSVPQMAAWIWNEPRFDAARLRKLHCWAIGGAPNPKANAERFLDAGIRIGDGFGMSEVCSAFGMPPYDFEALRNKVGSCGPAFLSFETRIVDEEGNDLAAGETGELWLRGPSITRGYWKQPEATAAAFEGGWFKTGDAGKFDEDGFFYIVDRKKDMYISGGENVYPAEVEAIIAELEDVAECAVVGVPDERWGEVGRAYIVAIPGRSLTGDHVIHHCRERLARFKAPGTVEIVDSLPRTASGKLQKHLLRARAREEIHD